MTASIGIVGGGFSGLYAGRLIAEALGSQVEIHIFEAAERLGGRIRTDSFDDGVMPFDAGVAELYDITGTPTLRSLVDDLSLSAETLRATPYFVHSGRIFRSEEDFYDQFGREAVRDLQAFWRRGMELRPPHHYASAGHPRDGDHPWIARTFQSVLGEISDPDIRRFTEVQVHSDVATEPWLTHGLFGFDNLLIDHPGYCSMFTLRGGNEGLVDRLAAGVDAVVHTRCPITAIEAEGGYYRLKYERESRRESLLVDFVIVTPPANQLWRIGWQPVELERAVETHVEHHRYWADYLRVTVLFRRRFWAEDLPEDYFVLDAFDGVTVYDQSRFSDSGLAVLSWLVAGRAASEMAPLSDGEIFRKVLATLPGSAAVARQEALSHRVHRWVGEQGVSRLPGGFPLQSLEARHRPCSHQPRLLFAGDYLYDATISGAADGVGWVVDRVVEDVAGVAPVSESELAESPSREDSTDRDRLPFLRHRR